MDKQKLLASLPSVDEILKSPRGREWLINFPRRCVLKAIRETIEAERQAILKGIAKELSFEDIAGSIQARIEKLTEPSLRHVINATGVVIHTNLGRSVLSEEVMEQVKKVACGYSNLEYELSKGKRGKRYSHVRDVVREITGAESCLIVNNNAAAVFLCLSALAKGKEVIVSRGELVEIGGSFRIPDVMSSSGALLREVGSTNKTHPRDYENAINENTAMLLKVHQSNYRMVGFTQAVGAEDLAALGKKHNIPVMFDLGSGCLIDLKPYGIQIEPTVQEIVKAGVDLVTFSGDKLLGGPQGGVIVGKTALINTIAKHPLMRAVRVDKLTLAAFEATLMQYLDEEKAKDNIPTLKMLLQSSESIRARAEKIVAFLDGAGGLNGSGTEVQIIEDSSQSGGGALPEIEFKTYAVSVRPRTISVNLLEEKLRRGHPPVIARIREDALILDARTILDGELESVAERLLAALKVCGGGCSSADS